MKYCTKCGTELQDGAKFCPKCGPPVSHTEYKVTGKQNDNDQSSTFTSL